MSKDLEASVLSSLKAYKKEKGMPEAAAATWASVNLKAGLARFQSDLAPYRGNPGEAGLKVAFKNLKAWAQSS